MKDVRSDGRRRPTRSPRPAMRPPRDYPWQDLWDDRPPDLEGDVEMAAEDFAADVQRANTERSQAVDSPATGTDEQFTGRDDYAGDTASGKVTDGHDDDRDGTLSDARLAYLAETGQ